LDFVLSARVVLLEFVGIVIGFVVGNIGAVVFEFEGLVVVLSLVIGLVHDIGVVVLKFGKQVVLSARVVLLEFVSFVIGFVVSIGPVVIVVLGFESQVGVMSVGAVIGFVIGFVVCDIGVVVVKFVLEFEKLVVIGFVIGIVVGDIGVVVVKFVLEFEKLVVIGFVVCDIGVVVVIAMVVLNFEKLVIGLGVRIGCVQFGIGLVQCEKVVKFLIVKGFGNVVMRKTGFGDVVMKKTGFGDVVMRMTGFGDVGFPKIGKVVGVVFLEVGMG
jgi:hypothetical protein